MNPFQEERARMLVSELEDAGSFSGLLMAGSTVVLRTSGSPYTDTPLLSFVESDLNNAVALGLVRSNTVFGSLQWAWHVLSYRVLHIDITELEDIRAKQPIDSTQIDGYTARVRETVSNGGKVIVERRFDNARPERQHTLSSMREWDEFRESFFGGNDEGERRV